MPGDDPLTKPRARFSCAGFLCTQILGGARPVTKPLAGCGRTRIVGTIGGTAHRPRLS